LHIITYAGNSKPQTELLPFIRSTILRLEIDCDLILAIFGTDGMRNLIYHSIQISSIMKNRYVIYSFLAILIGVFCFSSCTDYEQELPEEQLKSITEASLDIPPDCNFTTISSIELTDLEEEMLLFVWEEEKMARDVYLFLDEDERCKKPIFRKIADSEQVHMDKVFCLLIHFSLDDQVQDEIGIFSNPEIQILYDDLIALGSGPITDALTAGAIIEDFHIHDINVWMEKTENESILTVFGNIVCGSGNHLIKFVHQLKSFGIEYEPLYLSDDEYQAIINAGHQNCGQ